MRRMLLAGVALFATTPAFAAPVDLTGWTANVLNNAPGQASWNVQPGNNAVLQTINGEPTVFFKPAVNAQGTSLSGTIKVTTTGDDDFVGFVLGYSANEINSPTANFILIDWKQNNQGNASVGLAISLVTGAAGTTAVDDYWDHDGVVSEIARAATLGSTGWADNTEYTFDLKFLPNLIEVSVNGILEISITNTDAGLAAFDDGSFGFYNYSQSNVLYAGLTEDVIPDPDPDPDPGVTVPEPATLGLFGLGLLGLAGIRRRK